MTNNQRPPNVTPGAALPAPRRRARRVLVGVITAVALAAAGAAVLLEGGGGPTTAFASAPPGTYAVVAIPGAGEDTIAVVPVAGGEPLAVLQVGRLEGFASRGAVSPDGARVALVVPDGGTQTHPTGSLLVADLASGQARRLVSEIDVLQDPVWRPDGGELAVTRTQPAGDGTGAVEVLRVSVEGGVAYSAWSPGRTLGAYPVGYSPAGALYTVVIDARGSTLYEDAGPRLTLAPGITRDWELSLDRTRLAFIEVTTSSGVAYAARTMDLSGAGADGGVSAQSFVSGAQQLGTAWRPGDATATHGSEPAPSQGMVQAQVASGGFLVPLSYSPDGQTLAAEAYSGGSFRDPGSRSLALVSGGQHTPLPANARFFGWAAR